jgi:PAS domain S-box-containing protein
METFTDLYDFAPMGYMAIGRYGAILAANLAAAALIGMERSSMMGRSLGHYVAENDLAIFNTFLDSVFEGRGTQTCELTLLKEGNHPIFIRMEAVATASGDACRLALMDISELKQAQEDLSRELLHVEAALAKVKQLEGVIPICMYCKRIRDDQNNWQQLEQYISEHSQVVFTHGMCPPCSEVALKAVKDM